MTKSTVRNLKLVCLPYIGSSLDHQLQTIEGPF